MRTYVYKVLCIDVDEHISIQYTWTYIYTIKYLYVYKVLCIDIYMYIKNKNYTRNLGIFSIDSPPF